MDSVKYINSILKKEQNIFLLKKSSVPGILDNTLVGLAYLILNRNKDYLLITNKRIVCLVKNRLITNEEYNSFSKIQFNSSSDKIIFENLENKKQNLGLRKFRLSYEEIQKLKQILN
ncbi:hypothetical protein [Seonamhaeicola maritimus]|uniref:hypothetical protein n=1 Tax=Seonamhaeicola maritimus TaxID=2591822 RepID=UPI0024954439|nr:hypothetical protein [Seonamhaeicola maritimus]